MAIGAMLMIMLGLNTPLHDGDAWVAGDRRVKCGNLTTVDRQSDDDVKHDDENRSRHIGDALLIRGTNGP